MKLPVLILVAVVAILSVAPAAAGEPSAQERIEASVQKIKEFQKERLAILKPAADQALADFQLGRGRYEEVLKAQQLLLTAELDFAEKESERIALYAKAVEVLKKCEKVAEANFAVGRDNMAPVLRIKARRLEVEIQLERAKIREAKGGK
jgi:outer membrane protein TolC